MAYDIGMDVGSVSINCVVVDDRLQIVHETPYLRHFGLAREEAGRLLKSLLESDRFGGPAHIRSVSFTGVHGERIAEILDSPYEVETIAQVLGVLHITPGARTIISMGGQDAALLRIGGDPEQWRLEAFSMNGPCASGTGSFIDQQAERLAASLYGSDFHLTQEKLQQTLEDFIALGLESTYPASVACRCTVFTKSDMIHLQNKGESLANIIAGLHYGNAANYVSTIVAGQEIQDPTLFIGGMASNRLQVEAFRHYFPRLSVPAHHTSLGALGAALQTRKQGLSNKVELERLKGSGLLSPEALPRTEPLKSRLRRFTEDHSLPPWSELTKTPVPAFLGVDIGSTTTKYALIDEEGRILHKCYVPTRGKPIEVTQGLLKTLLAQTGKGIRLMAIATTGSGRNVVGDFLAADLVIDEITAHAQGAVQVDPQIDTIFELGGQDSKYIRIEDTHPLDFDMNKVCAAGTGSFLHELANKMKINIVGEFQEIALSAQRPVHLAERCTVFMESDLVGYAQKGAAREDLIAGLCYAIVHNYLNRVVEKRYIGQRIMFLGGPSLNEGIVAAFERVLNRPVIVPANREVMGAYGAALAVRQRVRKSAMDRQARDLEALAETSVRFAETICKADKKCHNECKLKVYDFGEHKSIWGGDCGRYEVTHHDGEAETNFFLERQQVFYESLGESGARVAEPGAVRQGGTRPSVGVPMALHSLEWGVFWAHLLAELGFDVLVSPRTNNRLVLGGLENMTSETCFPVKVFHGHVRHLMDHVEYLFLPTVLNMPTPSQQETGFFCPLVQGSPYMVKAALRIKDQRVLAPLLHLKDGPGYLAKAVGEALPLSLRQDPVTLQRAVDRAWTKQLSYRERLLQRGREVLEGVSPDEPLWVITGRPYNLHDERLNLQLGRHLAKLGIKALPQDFLNLRNEDLTDFPRMYWGLGAKILRAAKRMCRTSNWYGVHLTNFSCGPDSFIEHFYRHILKGKPYLILELDEHSAVAGLLTRLEAYRNVVRNVEDSHWETRKPEHGKLRRSGGI